MEEINRKLTPKLAKEITSHHKFDNTDLATAIQSGNEIYITGEYYAFSAATYQTAFNAILFPETPIKYTNANYATIKKNAKAYKQEQLHKLKTLSIRGKK